MASRAAFALETDQFTLPPGPIPDIGASVSKEFYASLDEILAGQTKKPLSERDIPEKLYKKLGKGLFKTDLERFIKSKDIPKEARFLPGKYSSIYAKVILPIPGGLIVQAATIQMYGHQFGEDKIGHFIQQGWEYYKKYFKHEGGRGLFDAIKNGVNQEKTYYGTAVSGVYSNADLAANYAGFYFLLNLTRKIKIGEKELGALIVNNGETWEFSPSVNKDDLLSPYVSAHWNEALNPSEYTFERGIIRNAVRKRCESWQNLLGEDFNQEYFASKMAEYASWYGQYYGVRRRDKETVSLAAECFEMKDDGSEE
jgi:hypothetical protein